MAHSLTNCRLVLPRDGSALGPLPPTSLSAGKCRLCVASRRSASRPLDGIQSGTVRRQEHQGEHLAVLVTARAKHAGVVVPGVVQNQHETLAASAMLSRRHQKALKGFAIEDRLKAVTSVPVRMLPPITPRTCGWAHAAGPGSLSSGGTHMRQRVPCWLEVAFVGTPEINPRVGGQAAAVFLKAACAAGSALAMRGRGLRSRNPIWPNSR